MDNEILEKTKKHFFNTFKESKSAYPYLPRHVKEVEKWSKKIVQRYLEADEEILLLSVWLHDIGQAINGDNPDHAVRSEIETRDFLFKIGLESEKIEKIAHCVRAHRCRDIQPEIIEARILAASDSASHMTDINYIVHINDGWTKKEVLEKLERDYRDVGLFPEIQQEIEPLYKIWKKLIETYLIIKE